MRTIYKICFLFIASLLFFSCKKEGAQVDLKTGIFPATALSASGTTVVLSPDKENQKAISFQWQSAEFGGQPVISYVLQLGTIADTANNWASAKSITIDAGKTSYDFIVKDLNNLLNSMNVTPNVANKIAVRIRADVNQLNGAASTITPTFSNTLTSEITSYALDLYVPGDYQNWTPAAAPKLAAVAGKPGLYEGYVNMPGAGQHYFKYTNAPDWDHTNYGDGGNGTFNTDGNAAGLSVPDGGFYYLTANLNNNTWTATKVVWGILGDASPGKWDTDTEMSYNAAQQVWTVTADMIKNGSFKFRANKEWKLDFGLDANGKLHYANNPFLGYTDGLNNLSVPEDGNYTLILDLHIAGQYTYTLQKN